jgi:hypothetical protein
MRFGWFIALPLLFVALLAGSCGYAMGVGSVAVAPVATAPVVHTGWGFGFFPFFGFIFFLVVIFAVVGALKRRAWGGRGGWYGPGYGPRSGSDRGWYSSSTNAQFEEWHRRMHGEPSEPKARKPVPEEPTTGELVIPPWEPPTGPATPPQDENTKL